MSAGIEIIILLVAVVVLMYFLINTLGTRDGFEPEKRPNLQRIVSDEPEELVEDVDDEVEVYAAENSKLANALRQAKLVEPSFRVGEFLTGAKSAYELVVTGFLAGDIDNFKSFIADEIYLGFQQAIDDRKQAGHVIDASFVGFRDVTVTDGHFEPRDRELTLTVDFTAQLTRQVSDADGNVIEGSKTKAETEVDSWQFARNMGSDNPNWTLISTGV